MGGVLGKLVGGGISCGLQAVGLFYFILRIIMI